MRTELVQIIENLLTGDRTKALAYAELLVMNCERKYEQTNDIFDKYEIMGARNIVHMMKGEPKEGGTVVLDDCSGRNEQSVENAESKKLEQIKELRECLKIIRDNLVCHTIKSNDGKYVNHGAFLSEEFVDDERWRKALRGDAL